MRMFALSFVLSLLASSSVLAAGTIAKYSTRVEGGVGLIELKDNGNLKVNVYSPPSWGSDSVGPEKAITVALDKRTFEDIRSKIINLSSAPLKHTYQDIVCMMMALPGPSSDLWVKRGYDWDQNRFTGKIEEVMDGRGCWAHHHVNPEQEEHRLMAFYVKGALAALAREAVAKQAE